jgi:hypothetical protein
MLAFPATAIFAVSLQPAATPNACHCNIKKLA